MPPPRRPTPLAPERPALDLDAVVQAALAVLDDAGLEGLTMRRLADRLGVKAASLYWHVRDKNGLLEVLGDAICAAIRPPNPDLPWRARLEELAWENRRVMLAHRDGGRVLAATPPVGPNRLRQIELALSALCDAGFGPRAAFNAGLLLADFLTTFVIEETRYAPTGAADAPSLAQARAIVAARFRALPPDMFPSLAALADAVLDTDMDARFRFDVAILLDGMEHQLAQPGAGPGDKG